MAIGAIEVMTDLANDGKVNGNGPISGTLSGAIKGAASIAKSVGHVLSNAISSDEEGAKKVHGNSSKSTKKQHTYDVVDKDGKVDKGGLSGGKISEKGKSYRGEQSARKREKVLGLKKGELTSRITRQDIPGRKKGLFSESHQRGKHRNTDKDSLPGNKEKGETSRIRDRENAKQSIDNDGGRAPDRGTETNGF